MNDDLSGPHQVYDFRGSPYQIGFQQGRTLRERIITEAQGALERFAQTQGTSTEKFLEAFRAAYEPLFTKHLPQQIEEIHGMATGAELSYAHAFFAATRDGARGPDSYTADCTAFVCGKSTTRDGKVLIGQTKDTNAPLERYHIMRFAYDSGRKILALNYPGWSANIGITSDGVAFTGNALYAQDSANGVAPFSLLKRLTLETPSVKELLRRIEGLAFPNGCLIAGDATGQAACFECVTGQVSIRDVSGQAFGHANSILTDELRKYETNVPGTRSSTIRQRNVQRLLDANAGQITMDTLKEIVRDHTDFPLGICHHPSPEEPCHTTAAFLADLTDLEMEIAIGNPCTAKFKRYNME